MLHDHVKSIDPGGTERKFATRIARPDYCNAGRRAAEADGSGTWAPERPKTKRQNTLRKSLKSLPDERPVIKTKTKGKGRDRDDVSFDLDEEEEEEDEEMEKERMQEKRKRHVEREKRTRSMREMIVYEARGVVYCPWMILSHSEEETLKEQILDCVQEEWDEAEVTLAAHEEIEGEGRTLRMRREDSVYRGIPMHLNMGKRNTVKRRRSKEVWIPMASTLSSVLSKLNRRWKLPRWLPACLLAGLRCSPDVPRMEKSPLLANGYNHPPTHLSHMQFMQLGGHPGAGHTAILSPASLPHHLQAQAQARAEQGLKVNPNMTNMEALARSVSRRANTTNRQRKSVETVSGVLTLDPGISLQDNVLGHFQSAVDIKDVEGREKIVPDRGLRSLGFHAEISNAFRAHE
ncbi:hypothetical protein ALC57_06712 [Trachymyrmex cornetzi]|uniref:Uncharacterized protein n=1 Tax=Trachymyrmex cornetzi TaxID=471704 RepID=A0A195E6T7_9HYME|nr:hypothetical protein ALC57_06712 [Trachymyrmex cornetzi]